MALLKSRLLTLLPEVAGSKLDSQSNHKASTLVKFPHPTPFLNNPPSQFYENPHMNFSNQSRPLNNIISTAFNYSNYPQAVVNYNVPVTPQPPVKSGVIRFSSTASHNSRLVTQADGGFGHRYCRPRTKHQTYAYFQNFHFLRDLSLSVDKIAIQFCII